ncbi:MAG: substrate-binding periplasmic protein [Bdellovibrionales bacterium]
MKPLQFLSVLLLSAAVAFGTVHFSGAPQTASAPQKETRWEQIKKRGTLRCGYMVWPPFHMKDPNTGEMTGIMPDIMEAIASQLGLKLEWTEEVDYAHMFSGYNRYDLACTPVTSNGSRVRETDFSRDFGYTGLYGFVRADDSRFDNDITRLNDPSVRVSLIDGEYSNIIVAEDFPKAQPVAITQMGNGSQMILQVATKKADFAITDPFSGQGFMENNPDSIKLVSKKPIRVLDLSLPIPHDEPAFKAAVDVTISNLSRIGALDRIYRRYERGIAKVIRVAKPYQE